MCTIDKRIDASSSALRKQVCKTENQACRRCDLIYDHEPGLVIENGDHGIQGCICARGRQGNVDYMKRDLMAG